jgi:hypothetical protein
MYDGQRTIEKIRRRPNEWINEWLKFMMFMLLEFLTILIS